MYNIIEEKLEENVLTKTYTYKIGRNSYTIKSTSNIPSEEALKNFVKEIFNIIK